MKTLINYAFAVVALVVMTLGPAGLAMAQAQIKVTSAVPAETSQGTVSLDVTVNGSGFDNTATAQFFVTGTADTGGITVRRVVFKGSKQLVATIDVADTAVVNKFDIEVALSSGRKGKGTTLFSVLRKAAALDPCIGQTAAFVMSEAEPEVALYLLNATATCKRYLFSPTSGTYDRVSSFRVTGAAGSQEGRIVVTNGVDGLTLIRFPIAPNMHVDPASIVSRRIFESQQYDFVDNGLFQLAADGHRLAYIVTNSNDFRSQVRFINDVDACIPSTPGAPACSLDVGTLLAEHVGLNYVFENPRWSTDGSWIYFEDRRGKYGSPYISRVSPHAPLAPGEEPEIVLSGNNLRLFELRSRDGDEVMVFGEKSGSGCREVRVVRTASCSNSLCGAQINSTSPRVLSSGFATLHSIDSMSMTLLTDGAKEHRQGYCVATHEIIRAQDSPATGVTTAPLTRGRYPAAR